MTSDTFLLIGTIVMVIALLTFIVGLFMSADVAKLFYGITVTLVGIGNVFSGIALILKYLSK